VIATVLVVLVAEPGPAIDTVALTPDDTAPTPARTPRARAPPPTKPHHAELDPADVACPARLTQSLVPELQADGRVHDRMLDPNDRPDYEENEGRYHAA
jgi:hypothetical protein